MSQEARKTFSASLLISDSNRIISLDFSDPNRIISLDFSDSNRIISLDFFQFLPNYLFGLFLFSYLCSMK